MSMRSSVLAGLLQLSGLRSLCNWYLLLTVLEWCHQAKCDSVSEPSRCMYVCVYVCMYSAFPGWGNDLLKGHRVRRFSATTEPFAASESAVAR
jgi:hypothetical protein